VPNAYTLAVQGKTPFIVLHTSIVDLMTPEEVRVYKELGVYVLR
jgi:Zn-dependent protease with chaperone function